jgi:LuxR family maltose regulon positive regulatory protein
MATSPHQPNDYWERRVAAMDQLTGHTMSLHLRTDLTQVDLQGVGWGRSDQGRNCGLAVDACKLPTDVRDWAAVDPCARLILKAWSALAAMKLAEGVAIVEAIEAIDKECASFLSPSARFERVIFRGIVRALRDDATCSVELVEALKDYPAGGGHPAVPFLLRFGHWKARRLDSFFDLSRPLETYPRDRREAVFSALHLSMEAAVEMEQLRPVSAARLAEEALELAAKFLGAGFAGVRLSAGLSARAMYEQNQIDAADALIRDRLALSSMQGGLEGALVAYIVGSRIAAARRQTRFAVLLLSEAESLGEEWGWPRLVATSLAERVRILVGDGKLKEARLCAGRLYGLVARHTNSSTDHQVARLVVLTDARLELASEVTPETAERLRKVIDEGMARKECEGAVEPMLLLSCVLHRIGRDREARSEALRVIALGAHAGLYRVFIDGGHAVRELLHWVYRMQTTTGGVLCELRSYVRNLLVGFPVQEPERPSARNRHRSGDSLSPRERYIVEFMSHGLSNKQIARKLGIAPETVKSHAKHILLKLAARTRVEAVSRALSLGMF